MQKLSEVFRGSIIEIITTVGLTTLLFSTSAHSNSFSVQSSQIIDPNGDEFVVQGVNIFPDNSEARDQIVDCWGFNTVRANHFVDWAWYGADWEFDLLESNFADQGTVVILDLAHDAYGSDAGIGRYWLSRQQELIDLYTYYAERYKDNPYVWFELINEPDTLSYNSSAWVQIHQALVTAIRDTGNQNPIIVSGWCWGQDACGWGNSTITANESAILGLGDQIMTINNEPQSNIIFTHHVFDQFQYGSLSRLTDYHDAVQAKNYALIVGEYSSSNVNSTMTATNYMFQSTQARNIGRIAWNWHANDNGDLTTNTAYNGGGDGIDSCLAPTNLTALGQLVWDDNHGSN